MVMLQSTDEFEVVGQAANGQQAIRLAEEFRPDVVLIDVQMPQMGGIEATHYIRQRVPATQVVILSSFDQDEYIYKSFQAGAKGFLLKDTDLEQLLSVVRAAARGESLLPPHIATKLAESISDQQVQQNLTKREGDVLSLMVQGLRNKEIANQLEVSERTIKSHVANVLAKLGARSRTEAVSLAIKERWVAF